MEIRLDAEIANLRKTLLEMGNAVETSVVEAIKALKDLNQLLATKVIENDNYINRLEVTIDQICLKIFALKQPFAIDLRFVASSLKVNNDLERMGDLAVKIAEDVIELVKMQDTPYIEELYSLTEKTQLMVKLSMEAYMQKNVTVAQKVIWQDKAVDKLYASVIKKVGPYVHEDSERFEMGLKLINISKCLERIGDHATNICEDAIYLAEGEIIKHQHSKMKMR